MHVPGKDESGKPDREFESLTLRRFERSENTAEGSEQTALLAGEIRRPLRYEQAERSSQRCTEAVSFESLTLRRFERSENIAEVRAGGGRGTGVPRVGEI